jgi:hypothetical protein
MKVRIRGRLLRELAERTGNKNLTDRLRVRGDDTMMDVRLESLTGEERDILNDLAGGADAPGGSAILRKLAAYKNLQANPSGAKIKSLEALVEALRQYVAPSPNKWVFGERADGQTVPYFVMNIRYVPPERRYERVGRVHLGLAALYLEANETTTVTFFGEELRGKTVVELLHSKGFYLETEAAVEAYLEQMDAYNRMVAGTGAQYNATGHGFLVASSRWERDIVPMEREGEPTKTVIDDKAEEVRTQDRPDEMGLVSNSFWIKDRDDDHEEGEGSDGDEEARLPAHPYIRVFDLRRHQHVAIHVNNLAAYEYDGSLAEKLVLPKEERELIDTLVSSAGEVMEDIVKGKAGGVIVMASGPAGTGKTLTAEVSSEKVRRPLYAVQCSQLGTDEEALEQKLGLVLERATRWGAVLLIDEADVYVRARGTDIQQNAIVGVFLRVLEYYRGILFMTTNLETVIDDAILSRVTAWVRYKRPESAEDRTRLWMILSKQYGIKLEMSAVEEMVESLPQVSGRSIRNVLHLAAVVAKRRRVAVDTGLLKFAARFQAIEDVLAEEAI